MRLSFDIRPTASILLLLLITPTTTQHAKIWTLFQLKDSHPANSPTKPSWTIARRDVSTASSPAISTPSNITLPPSDTNPNPNSNTNDSIHPSLSQTALTPILIPPNCYKQNDIPIGWSVPLSTNIMDVQNRLAPHTTPCTYGTYAHITSKDNYGTKNMRTAALAAAKAHAVLSLSLQPFIPFSQISASRIAAEMTSLLQILHDHNGHDQIYLRFAHEMNWYIDTNAIHHGPTHYHGTPTEFKTLWQAIATAVDRNKIKMHYSPNIPGWPPDSLKKVHDTWYPGDGYVDIVGLDVYPQSRAVTFESAFGELCDMYPGKAVQLAETGWLRGGSVEERVYWWGEVTKAGSRGRCPGYVGFSWFEYLKGDKNSDGGDFRVSGLVGQGGG
ncbi:hypothetical protein ACLMJK_002757 [Lecanora helva]